MKTYAIDFETYYDKEISIQTLGTYNYIRHPECDIYMMSVVGDDLEWVGRPEEFDWKKIAGARWIAHNYYFDGAIVALLRERGIIPESVQPGDWNCTANLSVYNHAPRNLAGAAKFLLHAEVSKDMRAWMKGRTYHDLVVSGKLEDMKRYNLHDGKLCKAIWDKHGKDWPALEQWLSRHTIEMGWRGLHTDVLLLEQSITRLQKVKWEAQNNLPFYKPGAKGLSIVEFHKSCRAAGVVPPATTAKDDPRCAEWEETNSHIPWVRYMRDWRRANVALARLTKMRDRTRADGTCPFGLKYYGGHTGRWSGEGGLNFQNQNRETLEYDEHTGFRS